MAGAVTDNDAWPSAPVTTTSAPLMTVMPSSSAPLTRLTTVTRRPASLGPALTNTAGSLCTGGTAGAVAVIAALPAWPPPVSMPSPSTAATVGAVETQSSGTPTSALPLMSRAMACSRMMSPWRTGRPGVRITTSATSAGSAGSTQAPRLQVCPSGHSPSPRPPALLGAAEPGEALLALAALGLGPAGLGGVAPALAADVVCRAGRIDGAALPLLARPHDAALEERAGVVVHAAQGVGAAAGPALLALEAVAAVDAIGRGARALPADPRHAPFPVDAVGIVEAATQAAAVPAGPRAAVALHVADAHCLAAAGVADLAAVAVGVHFTLARRRLGHGAQTVDADEPAEAVEVRVAEGQRAGTIGSLTSGLFAAAAGAEDENRRDRGHACEGRHAG